MCIKVELFSIVAIRGRSFFCICLNECLFTGDVFKKTYAEPQETLCYDISAI